MIFIPQKNKKNKSRMYAIASAAFASAAIVADVAYGAGTGAVDSTVEINDSTANGPVLSNDYDYFGWSVANIGDLNNDGVSDLAVGAYGDGDDVGGGNDKGTVHIMFMNIDGTVDSTVEINDSTANGPTLDNYDAFGSSIANIGDLNNDGVSDIAVGAINDNEGGGGRGAVHIMFMNTDGTVDSTVEINDTTTNGPVLSNNDSFGSSIANIGDLNNDGVSDLAVGAWRDDEGGSDRGAVHIMFMNTDGTVDSTVEINDNTANGPVLNNGFLFGRSIANIGDLNNDGVSDIAAGSAFYSIEGYGFGAVHIMFMNTDGSVDSTVEINNNTVNGPVLSEYDYFGTSIASISDLNNDGVSDLAVGAFRDDNSGSDRGAMHILFMNTDGTVDSTVEINDSTANGPVLSDYDYFGRSIANIGDLDGNGINDLAVGANADDNGGTGRGSVHILFMYGTPAESSPSGSGGGHSSITASCNPSDRTVSVGDKVSFDIDIDTTEDSYTFKWTKVLSGTDEDESHRFTEEGKFYPRAEAKDSAGNKTTVNCGTITVEGDDDADEDTNNDDTSSSNNNNPLYELVKKFQKELTLFQSIGISLPSTVQEILNSLNKTNNNTTNNTPTFTRDLELGMEGEDVKQLQIFLNNNGYTVSTQGPGSPNNETTRFGYATQSALINFQKANNITPALGYFGPVTRELVNTLF